MSAGARLGALLAVGVLAGVPAHTLPGPLALTLALPLMCALGLAVAWRAPLRTVARRTVPLLALTIVLAAVHVLGGTPLRGLEVVLDLVAVAVVAHAITLTTPTTAMLDALDRGARRMGLSPARAWTMSLAVSLMLRAIPVLGGVVTSAREAARARGAERRIGAIAGSATVRAVGHAQRTGEALAARGLADPVPDAAVRTAS